MAEDIPTPSRSLINPRSEDGHGHLAIHPSFVQIVNGTPGVDPVIVTTSPTGSTTLFAAVGASPTIDVSQFPVTKYSIQVTGEGAAATAWNVDLEASLDGLTFTIVQTHATIDGDGQVVFNGANLAPSLFFRANVTVLTLGAATGITVIILGLQ